jgi:ABC-type multidrug transport system ATPase subunit
LEKVQNNNTYMISGGQKKVLMFCISYIADADYLILDEPTSMVDIIARQKIWDIINSIKKEKGILISSHDTLEVMNVADKVVALKCGKQSFYGDIESNNENDFRKELVKYV